MSTPRIDSSEPEHVIDRRLAIAASVAALLLLTPLMVPLMRGQVFATSDSAVFHLPLRHIYSVALKSGDSLLWTTRLFGGFYVHGEGQVGIFHPFHLLLYRFAPLQVAFNLELVSGYVFAFLGMHLFLRRQGLMLSAALVGAIAFTFSGFNLLNAGHMNVVEVAAHIPWLLLALSSATSNSGDHKRWSLLGLSLLLGSQLLLGHPQTVWFSAVACVVYVGCRASEFARFSLLALLVVAAASGVMLGSTQLLPSLDLLEQSARGNPTRDFRLSLSLHPFNLAQLWSPYVFPNRTYGLPRENFVHEFGVYNGALCSLAVVWALIRRKRISHPRLAAFGALVGGVGLLLALGRYGGVYELLTALPLVGKFRGPTRHILLVHWAWQSSPR